VPLGLENGDGSGVVDHWEGTPVLRASSPLSPV
jgi:hypothetical protein